MRGRSYLAYFVGSSLPTARFVACLLRLIQVHEIRTRDSRCKIVRTGASEGDSTNAAIWILGGYKCCAIACSAPDFYVAVNAEERIVVGKSVLIASVCQCLFICLQQCAELTQDEYSYELVLRVCR